MPFPSQPMYTLIKTTTVLIFPPWKNFACPWTSYWLNYIVCTLLAMVSFNLYEMFYVLSSFNSLLSSSIQLTNHHWDYKHSIDRKMGCFQFWVVMNKNAMNILVHVFLWNLLSIWRYVPSLTGNPRIRWETSPWSYPHLSRSRKFSDSAGLGTAVVLPLSTIWREPGL